MKQLCKYISRILLLTEAVLLLGCGTFNNTKEFIQSCGSFDPPVDTFNAVYRKGDVIAVDYSVKPPESKNQVKKSDKYWAELKISRLNHNLHSKEGISLHREPIPDRITNKWEKLPIQEWEKLSMRKPERADSGDIVGQPISEVFYDGHKWLIRKPERANFDDIGRRPISDTPEVFYDGHNWLYILYSPEKGGRMKGFCPRGRYISFWNYPSIVVLLPLVIVVDVITLPEQWAGWMMWKDVH